MKDYISTRTRSALASGLETALKQGSGPRVGDNKLARPSSFRKALPEGGAFRVSERSKRISLGTDTQAEREVAEGAFGMRVAIGVLFALCLSGSLTPSARAQEKAAAPAASDIATLDRCLQGSGDTPRNCIGAISNECQKAPEGSTTPGIVACDERETAVWDRLLNERYRTTTVSTKEMASEAPEEVGDIDAVAKLRDAQRKWVAFRDAECDRIYAYYAAGTIRGPAYAYCQMKLTAERAIDLAPEGF